MSQVSSQQPSILILSSGGKNGLGRYKTKGRGLFPQLPSYVTVEIYLFSWLICLSLYRKETIILLTS